MWRSMFIVVVIGAALMTVTHAIPFRDPAGDLAFTIGEGGGPFGSPSGRPLSKSVVIAKGDLDTTGTGQSITTLLARSGPAKRKEPDVIPENHWKTLDLRGRRPLQFLYFLALMKAAKESGGRK